MSNIKTLLAAKEGIVLTGTVEGLGLGFHGAMANLIATSFNAVVASESRGVITIDTVDGRNPDGLAIMLGLIPEPERFEANFNVYALGEVGYIDNDKENIDLYVADLEGDRMAIAYCSASSFEELQSAAGEKLMSSLVFDKADLPEVLELLGQDFSVLPSQEDIEEAEQATKH